MEREKKEYKYMVVTRCFTFNHAPYIVDAMNGFTIQETTFPVITLIIDDASTDGEPDVIRQYLTGHFQKPYRTEDNNDYQLICANHKSNPNCKFIVFLLKYNHYCIKKSKFPYLSEWLDNTKYHAICEGDDYWIHPSKLEMQVTILEKYNQIGLCYTKTNVLNQAQGTLNNNRGKRFRNVKELILQDSVYTLTTLYRASLFQEYYKEISPDLRNWKMGDYPLWIWIALHSDSYFLEETTSVYRVLKNSASHNENIEIVRSFAMSVYEVQNFFIDRYFPDDYKLKQKVGNRNKRRLAHLFAKHKDFDNSVKYFMEVNPKTIKDWLYIIFMKCNMSQICNFFS